MAKKFNLKGLFIQTEEDSSAPTQAPVATPTFSVNVKAPAVNIAASVDPVISASLSKAMEDANLPSYDYLEFAQAVEQQASIIPDEAIRFKSVGMIATQMGTTPEKLIEAAQRYLAVLKSKEEEFLKAMQDNLGSVDTIDKEVAAIDIRVKELADEVARLQEAKKEKLEKVAQTRTQIETVKANFYATLGVFTGKITTDMEKITAYLIKK